jgi:hypothetical protein
MVHKENTNENNDSEYLEIWCPGACPLTYRKKYRPIRDKEGTVPDSTL